MSGIDAVRLLAGQMLALDRSALPALSSHADMRLGGGGMAAFHERAARGDFSSTEVRVQREGAIAVVPLVGLITPDPLMVWLFGGTSPDALVRALRSAAADREVSTIVLLTNSPGGSVDLLPETAAEIRRLAAIKPIVAMARTMMCSAAYWLAAQATRIVATPSALVGSVGVYTVHYDVSQLNERVGVVPTYIASDPKKVEGNQDEPLADDARAFIQAGVDEKYGQFLADLARGRGTSVATARAKFGSGRAFVAAEARGRGMVDEVGTFETVLSVGAGGRSSSRVALSDDDQMVVDQMAAWL